MSDLVQLKVSGLDGVLETLRQLPPEIVSKGGGPVKLALAKGARMLRDAARENLARVADTEESTGLLEENVVSKRGKMVGGEKQIVTVRNKLYPGRSAKGAATTRKSAHLLEYGSKRQAATPWLRPAAAANWQRIVDAVSSDLVRRVNLIKRKLGVK